MAELKECPACESCNGDGFVLAFSGQGYPVEIIACFACEKFHSSSAAGEFIEKSLKSHAALLGRLRGLAEKWSAVAHMMQIDERLAASLVEQCARELREAIQEGAQ